MNEKKKTMLVFNPYAGRGGGKKFLPQAINLLKPKSTHLAFRQSEYLGHLQEIGREAAREKYERIVAFGGDGTAFEVLNGLYEEGIPPQKFYFGIVPAGTGNSFLRDFGPPDTEEWIHRCAQHNTRKIDLVEFTYYQGIYKRKKYFLNIMGIGMIADILKLTNEKLKFLGPVSYSAAVLLRLVKRMRNHMTITVDGKLIEFENSALVINNSIYTGGAMKIAPKADPSDGMVDVIVFDRVNRREILQIFAGVFKGTHLEHPKVKMMRGSRIEFHSRPEQLLMADGELLGKTPMTLKILPGEIDLLV